MLVDTRETRSRWVGFSGRSANDKEGPSPSVRANVFVFERSGMMMMIADDDGVFDDGLQILRDPPLRATDPAPFFSRRPVFLYIQQMHQGLTT